MKVSKVNTAEYQKANQERREAIGATAVGGLLGHSVKYLKPVSRYEYDSYATDTLLLNLKSQVDGARASELKTIRQELENSKGAGVKNVIDFIANNKGSIILDQKDKLKEALDTLDDGTKLSAKEILKRIDESGFEASQIAEKSTAAAIKAMRPTVIFVAVGAAILASIMTLKNSLANTHKSYIEQAQRENLSLII